MYWGDWGCVGIFSEFWGWRFHSAEDQSVLKNLPTYSSAADFLILLCAWRFFVLCFAFFPSESLHCLTVILLDNSLNMGLQHTDSHNAAQILAVCIWNSLVLEWSINQILNTFSLVRPCDWRIKRLNLICHSRYMWVERHSVYVKSYYELVTLHTVFEYGRFKVAFWL